MSRQAFRLASFCAAVAAALAPAGVLADPITQTATLPLTATDFGPTTAPGLVSPLVFKQFDTQNQTLQLDAVDLTFRAAITNTFGMKFTTPATLTDSVATGDPNTPGPTITLYQPDGVHSLLTVKAPNDPAFLTRSVTYGSHPGESLPQSFGPDQAGKFYLAPALSQASNMMRLTAPSDLALFTGSGSLSLPVAAQAYSSFNTNSGNGFGRVTTQGSAAVTVTYEWSKKDTTPSPQNGGHVPGPPGTVPEPAALILWGIGGVTLLVARRFRRRVV